MDEEAVELRTHKHLFIDLSLVDRHEHVQLRVNPPRLGGVAIARDRAWEHHLWFHATVIDEGDRARMWYMSTKPARARQRSRTAWHGYAESSDGVTWHKPSLALVTFNGRTDNNLIPAKPHRANVFLDPTAAPEHRYKTFGLNLESEIGSIGYGVFSSSDGFTFRELGCNGIDLAGDTQNMAFWDGRLGRYVAYLRAFTPTADGDGRRAVARWETDDLTSCAGWELRNDPLLISDMPRISTELPIVIACDDDDPDDMDIYTPSVVKYPGAEDVYLATMSMYHHLTVDEMQDVDPPRNDGLMDIQLAVSRDGVTWTRPDRRPYVGIDAEGPGQRMVYAAQGLVLRGDRVLQYHTAFDHSHGHWPANNPGGVIRWTEQRLDGFVAAGFPYTGGELVTRPLTFTGDRLELNVDASASGEGRVELQDAQGRPVPGHSLSDSDRVLGNHLRHTVTWGRNRDPRRPAGNAGACSVRDARLQALRVPVRHLNPRPDRGVEDAMVGTPSPGCREPRTLRRLLA